MKQGSNRRLANVKTRTETGLEYVMQNLDLNTPFGRQLLKDTKPFYPGQEEELKRELDKVEGMIAFVRGSERQVSKMQETFMMMKDLSYTLERSHKNPLSVVELFEVKSMLLNMKALDKICGDHDCEVPKEFLLEDVEELLNYLDPRKDRLNTFYIYDDFSEKLAALRQSKHELEILIRKSQKARKEEIRREYGVALTPKFDVIISKSGEELKKARQISDLVQVSEDYMSVTFELAKSDEVFKLVKDMENINSEIEEEELAVRESLSQKVAKYDKILRSNCNKIGALDMALAKAIYGIRHNCVKPEIVKEHIIEIEDGRHLQVEDILLSKKKVYCPVSIKLAEGVTCITGANMGGKTISLKLAGLIPILAQYGFFVPCSKATIGLSNYMQILIGDSQSVERGLSSFGSEMEELKEMLDNSMDRTILLIDEIASGTNPVEGLALTKSLIDYLKSKPYISLITTHFEAVTEEKDIVNMQVRGLADADFRKLDSELHIASRKERINIISRYMDYRLYTVTENREIPKDALNIAKMLGLNEEIIKGAKKYIE